MAGIVLGLVLLPTVPLVLIFLVLLSRSARRVKPRSIAVVVLGDIGRSPRMLYHAQSLVDHGFHTTIVAYKGSNPPKSLTESDRVQFVHLSTPLAFVSALPRPLFIALSPFKVLAGAWALFSALVFTLNHTPEYILVQNPPSIPTLPIVKLALRVCPQSRLIIDWHNTGYSILALRLGNQSPLVKLAKWTESFWGSKAFAHLCVTEEMRKKLIKEVSLQGKVAVFHDRPPRHFRRQTAQEANSVCQTHSWLFKRIPFLAPLQDFYHSPSPTLFTINENANPSFFPPSQRPALLVSATSWTADEDFSILLEALKVYEKAAKAYAQGKGGLPQDALTSSGKSGTVLPKVLVVITGKGAGKEAFEREVERLDKSWEFVRVRTSWLALEDYPRLLGMSFSFRFAVSTLRGTLIGMLLMYAGSADLGISLHASSSGADLPMKVVDMFGCELPVLALGFECIDELVVHKKNGREFRDALGLADLLVELLKDPQREEMERYRKGIKEVRYGDEAEEWCTWQENWNRVVGPLVGSDRDR
ncbi:BQ2448_2982 [Microbotryum intermedium]|uniref:Chitobiosyldiphosphodolichol beta-mannosyltransferase n=1 Tax=Microbotryum intermedium TaxID=269621 RepID=A0A238FHN3_9BASI|nr:BQ2448_2982 [Microbotryum intermedium]